MNSKALTAALTAFALTLSACSGTSGKRIHLTPKSAADQQGGAQNKSDSGLANVMGQECLLLDSLVSGLEQIKQLAFVLHTRSVDVGTAQAGSGNVTSSTDSKTLATALKGTPMLFDTAFDKFSDPSSLEGYLAVKGQDECKTVTMSDPGTGADVVYTIDSTKSNSTTLVLSHNNETRIYSFTNEGALGITVLNRAEPMLAKCTGGAGLTIKQELEISWHDLTFDIGHVYVTALQKVGVQIPPGAAFADAKNSDQRPDMSPTKELSYPDYVLLKNTVDSWTPTDVCN